MSKNLLSLQNKFLGHGQTVYDKLANLREKQGFDSKAAQKTAQRLGIVA